jgi:hypothetical protein
MLAVVTLTRWRITANSMSLLANRPRMSTPRDVRALAFLVAVSAAMRRSSSPASDSRIASGTAICAIRLPCCGPPTRGRKDTGT